jgi:ubiquinone/menaquinone biosynthesis C-methylase UbiE
MAVPLLHRIPCERIGGVEMCSQMTRENSISNNLGLGSYYWGNFRDNSSEMIRLKKQASIGIEIEKAQWSKIPINKDAVVIDIGCGPGIIASELAKFASQGMVIGVDKNNTMIEQCKANQEFQKIENLSFQEGDVFELKIAESSVDIVYSRFLFQHLSDPIKALANIKNTLKRNGKVCIIDVDDNWLTLLPEPKHFKNYLQRVEKIQSDKGGDRFVGHKLQDYLSKVGFRNIVSEVKMIDSNFIPINDLIDMVINFKYQLVDDENIKNAEKERADIIRLCNNQFAWGAVGLFVAIGEK